MIVVAIIVPSPQRRRWSLLHRLRARAARAQPTPIARAGDPHR
jgi:hypothetical protein